jgi:hypothetical protein
MRIDAQKLKEFAGICALDYQCPLLLTFVLCVCVGGVALGQEPIVTDTISTVPFQQIKVDVPSYVAPTTDPLDTLQASVATVLRDPTVCCGRGSALDARLAPTGAASLPKVGERLRGKHNLPGGSLILVEDQYWSREGIRTDDVIASLMAKRPLLMDWDGQVYALYGAVFDLNKHSSGYEERVIRSFLLLDRLVDGQAKEGQTCKGMHEIRLCSAPNSVSYDTVTLVEIVRGCDQALQNGEQSRTIAFAFPASESHWSCHDRLVRRTRAGHASPTAARFWCAS